MPYLGGINAGSAVVFDLFECQIIILGFMKAILKYSVCPREFLLKFICSIQTL